MEEEIMAEVMVDTFKNFTVDELEEFCNKYNYSKEDIIRLLNEDLMSNTKVINQIADFSGVEGIAGSEMTEDEKAKLETDYVMIAGYSLGDAEKAAQYTLEFDKNDI